MKIPTGQNKCLPFLSDIHILKSCQNRSLAHYKIEWMDKNVINEYYQNNTYMLQRD